MDATPMKVGTVFKQITFSINGKNYSVGSNVPPSTTLLTYIREFARLPGSKACCYEGGCGVCTVVATIKDLENDTQKSFSLRSCQTLVYGCTGWAIETIEQLGNRFKGYHPLQKTLAGFYGTQCGYCSPGFIMNMYGELKSKKELTTKQVEMAVDGNICRCTGYRPILDAFKSFAVDAPEELKNKLVDIEDMFQSVCPNSGDECQGQCKNSKSEEGCLGKNNSVEIDDVIPLPTEDVNVELTVDDVQWYRPISLENFYGILRKKKITDKVKIVVGNTGAGVFKNDGPYDIYIDSGAVEDLYFVGIGSPLVIGANVNLNRCIDAFEENAKEHIGYKHLEEIAKHWKYVANTGIRNTGSWAGNLMLKHTHKEFPSDVFLTLAIADALILLGNYEDSSTKEVTVEELIQTDMSKHIILSMKIPPQEDSTMIKTYKITPRAVNAHAYVNAAFKFHVDSTDGFKNTKKPELLFGGINESFDHAKLTETYLTNQSLSSSSVIQEAMKNLAKEIKPDNKPQDALPAYRTNLAQSLLYKAILDIVGSKASVDIRSGGSILNRPISTGQQHYDENKSSWPVGRPVPKLESRVQVSGEGEYADDMELLADELHGAFVQSTVANATLKSIDASEALKLPGVVAFFKAKDIPGINSFVDQAGSEVDPVFVDSKISYYGQSIGLIVATRRDFALNAAKLVKAEYTDQQKPILTIKEALEKEGFQHSSNEEDFAKSAHVIEGELEQGSQFHMTMEPLMARVIPMEDGYDVFCPTQWPNETQGTMARVLGISNNSINLTVRRIGGGYGAKISRQNILCCAAAVAARKLRKPVRIALDLQTNMTLVGWREPYLSTYKVGFSETGVFDTVQVSLIGDAGFANNETTASYAHYYLPSVYKSPKWQFAPKIVKTNTAANTYCRTPGSTEAIATMETMIEHVAAFLKVDPMVIRERNFINKELEPKFKGYGPRGENLVRTKIFPLIKEQSMYETRRTEIDLFNQENRWKKKGITLVPLFYKLDYPPMRYNAQVVIYANDGTIVISHGGIEMGQGINTKAAQVAAKILLAPYNKIKVKPTDVVIGANSSVTGGSFGSDLVCHGVKECCDKLKERMDVVRAKYEKQYNKKIPWINLCKTCLSQNVDLSERFWTATDLHPKGYDIFGSVCMEVELDVLTGQFMIHRTDLIEDVGRSLSPYIDVGQIEGALIMGIGYYTSEIVKFNKETGEKISNNTWEYKVPTALDIPTDLRISFLPNGDNRNAGVVRSKATGEPALCMSYCIVTALRHAITSARKDAGKTETWFEMPVPLTVERIQQLCLVDPLKFTLNSKLSDDQEFLGMESEFYVVTSDEVPKQEESCHIN